MILVRRINEPNQELLKELWTQAGMRFEEVNKSFFEDYHNVLLVAYKENIPCGFVFGYILESIHSKKPLMFLYSIDVFEKFQGQGIGTMLIDELKILAIHNNCSEIFVFTTDDNMRAKKLYEKMGGKRENQTDVMYVYTIEE